MSQMFGIPGQVTRADLIKAFSFPGVPRSRTLELVKQYIGDAPLPPVWSKASVQGTFGQRVASRWARRIQHRPSGATSTGKGPVRVWTVQTLHDFGVSSIDEMMRMTASKKPLMKDKLLLVDEYWKFAGTRPDRGG